MPTTVMGSWIEGRYRVLRELGHGGMGIVYAVWDQVEGREVALKSMNHLDSQERRLRFQEEYRVMTKLKHPNIVDVYDFKILSQTRSCLVMELISGQDLDKRLTTTRLPLKELYGLLIQLLQTLEFIHTRGYIHRDIKPSNIRVCEDNTLKLMDFGLMEQRGLWSQGRVVGTPAYLAPEVVRGGVLDAWTDLYSVGCVAFEMIAGKVPFSGSVQEVIEGHLERPIPTLEALRPDIPRALATWVERLLAKDIEARPQDATTALAALADLAGARIATQNLAQKRSYLVTSALVGREAEYQSLLQALEGLVSQAKGGSWFVGAPAGVGKSRLVHELIIAAKLQGALVLFSRCQERGMAPYEGLAQLLSALQASTESLFAHKPLVHSRALKGVIEALSRDRKQPSASAEVGAEERPQLVKEISAWVQMVGEKVPLVLIVDDLQWCDPQSVEVLNALIRAQGRVLYLATFRSDEVLAGSPLYFTVQDQITRLIMLQPFDLQQTRTLIEAMLKRVHLDAQTLATIYRNTAGNVFFVTEVLKFLIDKNLLSISDTLQWQWAADFSSESLPDSVVALVQRRLDMLDVQTRQIAQIAAVLGRYPSRAALLAISGVSAEVLFAALDALIERHLLQRQETFYVFPHDRIREALEEGLSPSERRALHQRCGEYLLWQSDLPESAKINTLAHHFSRGNAPHLAYRYLLAAGDQAKATGEEATAINYWREASAFLERLSLADQEIQEHDLWWKIGENSIVLWPELSVSTGQRCLELLQRQGDVAFWCALLRRVFAVVQRLPPTLRGKVEASITRPMPYRHRVRRTWLERLLPPHIPSWAPRILELMVLQTVSLGLGGRPLEGLRVGRRAQALLPFTETPLEGCVLTAICGSLFTAGQFDELEHTARRGCQLLMEHDLTGQAIAKSARVGIASFSQLIVFQGRRFSDQLITYGEWAVRDLNKPDYFNSIWAYPAVWYAWTGRSSQAQALVERILDICRKVGATPFPWALYVRAYLAWQHGHDEDAHAIVTQALSYPLVQRTPLAYESLRLIQGHLLTMQGHFQDADALFSDILLRAQRVGMGLITIQALIGRGEAALRSADLSRAQANLCEALRLCKEGPLRNPLHHAIAARLLSEVAATRQTPDEANRWWQEALLIVTSPDQDNLLEQGKLLLLGGTFDHADAHLRLVEAQRLFSGIDNRFLLHQAHTLLSPNPPSRPPPQGSPLEHQPTITQLTTLEASPRRV